VNKSRGFLAKGVSVQENKRRIRRKKENRRISKKDAVMINVESLTKFLIKYTDYTFDEKFEVVENKVAVSTNQYKSLRTSVVDEDKVPTQDPASEDLVLDDSSFGLAPVEGGSCSATDLEVPDVDISNFEGTASEGLDVENNCRKGKYKHQKKIRTIRLKYNQTLVLVIFLP
jgi:hypothetical protein